MRFETHREKTTGRGIIMKIAVSAESTNDLTKELIEQNDIKVIPYHIVLNGEEFIDGDFSAEELFARVDKTGVLPKTNALNEFEYTEYFENLRKDYDAVIHICLSGGITSSCGNAFRAAENVKGVYVVDSRSLSTGIGLLVLYAKKLADAGVAPEEIQKKTQARAEKVQASFVIERLDYLYKGGRCNSLQLLGANIFKIRPRIVLKDGKMGMDKKYRGNMGAVMEKYCADVLNDYNNPDLDMVFITYTTATEEMLDAAYAACRSAGFKNIYETHAGCTIASHCGANTMGILYFNDGGNC